MSALASETEFVDAAACGDLDGVKLCLADPIFPAATINKVDKDGRSAFHYGCLNDDVPLLTVLFADQRVDTKLTTPNGDAALHLSSLYAALSAMRMLIDNGAELNAQNKYGETALHLVAGSGDKGARDAAKLLLERGAGLTTVDKWKRGPVDVSYDNSENPLVQVFNSYLSENPAVKVAVDAVTAAYKADSATPVYNDAANVAAKSAILGALGGGGGLLAGGLAGLKLKKTTTNHKSMFGDMEGKVREGAAPSMVEKGDGRKKLSQLIDFPGNLEEITGHLNSPDRIDPAGKDFYGLTALQKFASWNKTEYLDLLIPKLSAEELNGTDKEGKTALHWAVEMAAVASVKTLVAAGVDVTLKNNKGHSVKDILDNAQQSGVIDRLRKAVGE